MDEAKTILFFGNSLTAGYGLSNPSLESFPSLIRDKIDRKGLPYSIINAGLSGETTRGGKVRIDLLLDRKIDVFVLELGANDLLRGIPVTETALNLQAMIDKVTSRYPDVRMILLGMEVPSYILPDYATQFRVLFRRMAEKNRMAFVPFLLDGVAGVPGLNLRDGFHPSASGYRIIAETVWKVLEKML